MLQLVLNTCIKKQSTMTSAFIIKLMGMEPLFLTKVISIAYRPWPKIVNNFRICKLAKTTRNYTKN